MYNRTSYRTRKYGAKRTGRNGGRNARTGGYLGIEKKFYDTSVVADALVANADWSSAELDPAGGLNCLNAVPLADTEQGRDGRHIAMTSIHLRGTITVNPQVDQIAMAIAPIVYLALVLDRQTNGAQMSSETVYLNQSADVSCLSAPFRNLQYIERYKILKTWSTTIMPEQASYDGTNIEVAGQTIPFQMNVELQGLKVHFTGTTEVVGSIQDHSLHLIGVCTHAGMDPKVNYNSRLRFYG